MFTVSTMSHPGRDWSGGVHNVQTFSTATEVRIYYTENAGGNWNAVDVDKGIREAERNASGLSAGISLVESGDGEPYSIFLEIQYRTN